LVFQEAQGLSSLKQKLNEMGFHLYAVVHELKGVEEFKPFFDGEVYLDAEVISHIVTLCNDYVITRCCSAVTLWYRVKMAKHFFKNAKKSFAT